MAGTERGVRVLRRLAAPPPRGTIPFTSGRSLMVAVAVFVPAYGIAQSLSGLFETPAGVSVWFPPAALMLSFLLVVPPRVGLPTVVATRIGWALLLGSGSAPLWLTSGNALAVALAYLAAVRGINAHVSAPHHVDSPRRQQISAFLIFGGVLGPLLAAASTRFLALLADRVSSDAYLGDVADFWIGDAVAIVSIVPLLWAVLVLVRRTEPWPSLAELGVGVAASALGGWLVVGWYFGDSAPLYLALAPVMVLAVRQSLVGAALGSGAAALAMTSRLASGDVPVGVEAAHAFLIAMVVMALLVGMGESVRREAADDLALSEQRYRQMVEAVEDYAIYLLDPDGRVATWNEGAEKLKGYTADEIVGQSFEVLYTPEDRAAGVPAAVLDRAREHGQAQIEGWRVRRDGSRFWADVTVTRLTDDDDGRVLGFTKVTRDLTQRREDRLELELRTVQLERSNEDLDHFASVASHDLQEPLRMVASYTEMLERKYGDELNDDARELIAYAVDGARRMRQLISDLLEYSRITTRDEPVTGVDTQALVTEIREEMALLLQETGGTLEIGELPTVLGDPTRLRLLFENLIGNALKYRADKPPIVSVRAWPAEVGFWRFAVADNGIGIPTDSHAEIFEPFRRLHSRSEYAGTGIGLAICRRVVERLGGRIWVESRDNGVTMWFTLPVDTGADQGAPDGSI